MMGLLLGLQLSAFSFPLCAAAPDADTAAAVAIGLARAEHARIEVPVSVEVAKTKPSPSVDVRPPASEAIEWVRTCDQYGCRLVPRVPSPGASRPLPPANGASASASSVPGGEEGPGTAEGCRRRARRGLFGRWR